MLSRMNFAATLAANQRVQPGARRARRTGSRRSRCSNTCWRASRTPGSRATATRRVLDYLKAGATWTGTDAQLQHQGGRRSRASSSARASTSSIRDQRIRRSAMKVITADTSCGVGSPRSPSGSRRRRCCATSRSRRACRSRNLVVVYLGGGNDALSTVIPYRDANYYARRPTLAVPAGNVLQIGRDSSGVEIGLHPRLTGLKDVFDGGRLAIIQRTGLCEPEPVALHRLRHLGHGQPAELAGHGMAGALSRLAAAAGGSAGGVEHAARDAAPADGTARRRARDHEPRDLQLRQPERRPPRPCTSARRRRASRRTCPWIGHTWRS